MVLELKMADRQGNVVTIATMRTASVDILPTAELIAVRGKKIEAVKITEDLLAVITEKDDQVTRTMTAIAIVGEEAMKIILKILPNDLRAKKGARHQLHLHHRHP